MKKNAVISIILPCYNEGSNIYKNTLYLKAYLAKHLRSCKMEYILINDGSSDNTHTQILALSDTYKEIHSISYQENRGKGYAISQGVQAAQGDIIAFFDADLDISPSCLVSYIQILLCESDEYIIIGSKKMDQSIADVPLKRKILSGINQKINTILFQLPVGDTQVGLKVFRKELQKVFLKNVQTYGYAFDIDFLYHVSLAGYTIREEPVTLSIHNENSGIGNLALILFLKDIIILFRSIQYKIQKQKITFTTKMRVRALRYIFFPLEKILASLAYIIIQYKKL